MRSVEHKERKDQIDGVGIIIADSTNIDEVTEITLMKRGPKVRFSGQIENCGGSVKIGESPAEAALRELDEELGAKPIEIRHLYSYQPFENSSKKDHVFIVVLSNEPEIREKYLGKCSAILTCKKEELADLTLTEYARYDFERLGWISK